MDDPRAVVREGLNVFRALEAWGATLYAAWAETEPDPELRAGHLIIAEREATHARLLAERLRALGSEPGPACVDDVLARQLAELRHVRGFVAQLDALKACNARDAERMASCRQALDRGFEGAKSVDPATHRLLAQLYSEEKVSGAWYRATYSRLTGKRTDPVPPPVLEPAQVTRRAESAQPTGGKLAGSVAVG
jgi:rubrerythrin